MGDIAPCLLILGSLAAGFVWGRISAGLPIPEVLRLLTLPLWTGILGVLVGWCIGVARLGWAAPVIKDAAKHGVMPVTRLAFGYACVCFLAGAVLGLPAALGWVVAQPTKGRHVAIR